MSLPRRAFARMLLAGVLAALGCGPAAASFHLWSMDELYSSPDGKVQFLEMAALAPAQEFLSGHALTVTQGSTVHTVTVANSLPGDSSGRRMIFGTQSFANLGVVQPDVIVPDGFFFAGNGTIDWAGADLWNYANLPSDGRLSLNRNGTTDVNSPQNFAGQTGSVSLGSPPTARNYEGLWWRSPAGSESGWGVNITHQGDILFATWFTYDTDGSGMWLVASDVAKVAPDTYSGDLFRTTGPSFDSATFNPSAVVGTKVGTATFAFSDGDNGTFTYTVNGTTQSKPITRQVFSTVPTCTAGGTPSSPPNFQDLWWRSPAGSESGWGVNIAHQGDILFVTWFTYDASGKGMWLVGSDIAKTGTNTYSGALFRTTGPGFSASPWDPSKVVGTQVGTATFAFSDANNGTFTYTLGAVAQSKAITRQAFATPTTVCR